ncbi:MAG: PfkB family carbohydrate kinase [Dehalococcoidia bacterium]
MGTPEFVVIGHIVLDVMNGGWRLGGTAAFAAVQAQRLGLQVGIVSRAGTDVNLHEALPGVALAGRPSEVTTRFANEYEAGRRRQRVPAQAGELAIEDVPDAWRNAPVVLVGPVCGEVPAELGADLGSALTGVSAQGWLRRVDRARRVRRHAWTGAPFWKGCEVLFVSDEDLGRRPDQLAAWEADVPIVAVTRARRGAKVRDAKGWRRIEAFPANEVDPTGAGDVFAAAFLVRYHETKDAAEATRFGSAASACSVEGVGLDRVATRDEVQTRLGRHPEIRLR